MQPINRKTTASKPASKPAASRPASKPAKAPETPQPTGRGSFLAGVQPGQQRLPPHFDVRGRYLLQLKEVKSFQARNKSQVVLAEVRVVECLSDDCTLQQGARFTLFFPESTHVDVFNAEVARMTQALCGVTQEEMDEELSLPAHEQTLLATKFEELLDGNYNGNEYDVTFVGATTTKGANITRIYYNIED